VPIGVFAIVAKVGRYRRLCAIQGNGCLYSFSCTRAFFAGGVVFAKESVSLLGENPSMYFEERGGEECAPYARNEDRCGRSYDRLSVHGRRQSGHAYR